MANNKLTLFKRKNEIYYVKHRTASVRDKWTSTGRLTKREVTGNKQVRHFTRVDVDQFRHDRLTTNFAPTSINIQLRMLRAVLSLAVRWELIPMNPFSRVQQIRIPETPLRT